ncbi:NitT/TauT family transport system ATP-binding protein [Paraburkholderia silvatlantica]|uniref:NitT/TauT family transport system ATP-binding protein n=2 Tax=Paraburkholderia silvatlantica TaxID=321895 RepID=A0A2U1A6E8_9BURK|nr:NitT/TauT family transport system ATP-binding protein [Paraburkholderia silvatlantica]PXW34436.1 NitT/TauT family transport system ATP-binding protein [Paraburkholderia silvatlantica]PYE15714.1 NitT/TauT family transport system ATP-binding protein [Paraburkholderia silvatlantica]TDQ89397.1 NitT/TauT family transport system ATP-binding protein [Paraburkholderia silvatlantica]
MHARVETMSLPTNAVENRRPAITISGLHKKFGHDPLYDTFNLEIPAGSFTSIFGPNGCGKSTLINMMAGLTRHDGGQILFDGRDVRDVAIGYVFQNYRDALFPWRRASENIEYPLKIRGMARARRRERVQELAEQFDVRFDLNRYPYEFSGGQQQLISILRALAPHPEVVFLDEPFSALDYETTLFIREKLQSVFMQGNLTMILVSHDLEDAVYLADRVLMLTRRPTRVAAIVPFDLPYPRTDSTLHHPQFIAAKRRSLEIFQREVHR